MSEITSKAPEACLNPKNLVDVKLQVLLYCQLCIRLAKRAETSVSNKPGAMIPPKPSDFPRKPVIKPENAW